MISIRKWIDSFRGAGEAAVTVPSMDGALKPNSLLDRASVVWEGAEAPPTNLAPDGDGFIFSAGPELFGFGKAGDVRSLGHCEGPISATATHASGAIAVGVSGKGVFLRTSDGVFKRLGAAQPALDCPVAMVFESAGALIVANGSSTNPPEKWSRDLMEKNSSGSLWRIDVGSGSATCLASDLGFPAGVVVGGSDEIVVSESWRHRLISIRPNGRTETVLEDLPGYPGTIVRGRDGGYWLSIFAPRRQLIEFVLREEGYRRAMLETVDERYWAAPALKTGVDYFEPVQSGGVRHLGIVKPWAPTRSYGLVVWLDDEFNPRASYHSRADANRHGITSAVELTDRVVVSCAATSQLLAFDPNVAED